MLQKNRSPVTQTAEVAVNKESSIPVGRPVRDDTGKLSIKDPIKIKAANPSMIVRAGEGLSILFLLLPIKHKNALFMMPDILLYLKDY